jgi:Cellulase (glycosyl hydrolase family 5)
MVVAMKLLLALLMCLFYAGTAGAQTPPGAALPSGYLSIVGNQFASDLTGKNVRIAATTYRGAPTDQASMNAIRQAGFNAIRIDWRDAYLSAGGNGTPVFDDEFASAAWLTHATWQSGDKWSFAGTAFPGGTAQGPTWWVNPVDTPSGAPVYSDSGSALNLSLIQNPGGNGITQTTLGALINNQLTPGGNVLLFGYHEFSVAVPNVPGFLFQWDMECQPATCSDGSMEYDVGIWTNGDGSEHIRFWNQANGSGNPVYYETTTTDITKQNIVGVDWEAANTTFYLNGTQVAQIATPGGSFQTAAAFSYFLTSDATYFGYSSAGFTAASATAALDYYRIYTSKPSGTAPVGCNSLTQMDQCVALAAAATPQPLKVIFSHRGNEIPSSPSSACNARQANGLWFDSGGSSGNDDGCGDGGNVTYATFKANTAALMQRYAGNSTVIGYDFHAEPLINGAFTGTGGGGGGTGFTANNGQIFDPNGAPWVARGFSVTIEDMNAGFITPHNIQSIFPRVNYIRVSNFLGGGYTDGITPGAVSSAVTALTNLGIRVEFSDYAPTNTGSNGCRAGGDLAAANAWYQQWATFYASNKFVTWESQNECQTPGWQAQETSNYNAVRAGAPNAQFVIGLADGNYQINYEIDQAQLNLQSNVIFDGHPYAGSGGCGGSAASCGAQQVAGTQVFKALSTNTEANIPMIMGEVGDGVGSNPDPDGLHSIQAVFNNMSTGGSTSTNNGIGYWLWFCGQPWNSSCLGPDTGLSDTLVSYSSLTTLYPNDPQGTPQYFQGAIASAPGSGPTPAGGGTGTNPPVNWGGGGDTDIMAACNDVGAAVYAVNPGVIQFCEGPLNNGANNLLSGAAKP